MAENNGSQISTLGGQPCPICQKNTLTLHEQMVEVPYFGNMFLFGMDCSDCGYHKSDLEAAEQKEPCSYTFEVTSEEDLKIRVVKSSGATVKFTRVGSIESNATSNGYITNIEGLINRMKVIIEKVRDQSDDNTERKKAKNLVKKLQNVLWGREKLKISIEDKTGNSSIISENAIKKILK